jgi:hypothetical protein
VVMWLEPNKAVSSRVVVVSLPRTKRESQTPKYEVRERTV